MDISKLRQFLELAREMKTVELKYEGPEEKYYVNFAAESNPGAQIVMQPQVHHMAHPTSAHQPPMTSHNLQASPGAATAPQGQEVKKEGKPLIEVTSPFVGTFYKSPSPDAAQYVRVGDKVASGKVLCIIEAMKIMNEIESDLAGEIVEICVENESYVEFGQVLFRIRP